MVARSLEQYATKDLKFFWKSVLKWNQDKLQTNSMWEFKDFLIENKFLNSKCQSLNKKVNNFCYGTYGRMENFIKKKLLSSESFIKLKIIHWISLWLKVSIAIYQFHNLKCFDKSFQYQKNRSQPDTTQINFPRIASFMVHYKHQLK